MQKDVGVTDENRKSGVYEFIIRSIYKLHRDGSFIIDLITTVLFWKKLPW